MSVVAADADPQQRQRGAATAARCGNGGGMTDVRGDCVSWLLDKCWSECSTQASRSVATARVD